MNDSIVDRHIKIIIVEDEPAHAEAIKRYLSTSDHDCSISVAGSLSEFNNIVSGTTPNLVIADINLPDGKAFSLLGDIEDQKWPVLIMTSYGDEEIAVKAIKMGALDYIVKSPEAFRNIVHVVNRNLREWRNIQRSREAERKFRILFETMDQGVIYQDTDGRITAANPAAVRITGYSLSDMQHTAFFEKGPWFELAESGEEGSILPAKSHPAIEAKQTGKAVKDKVMGFKNPATSKFSWLLVSSVPTLKNIRKDNQLFTTFTDITEMMIAEMELKKAMKKAEESDRLKSVFMANMSHEIRTPMNGILGFADLLKSPELSGESQKLYIEAINSSGKRMLDIINDLIDISKIEAGQTELRKEPANIPELLKELIVFFRPEANKKNIQLKLEVHLPEYMAITETDRTKLAQVITNLLKNALKFTKSGGTIELKCTLKDQKVLLFSVKDNGSGIRKDLQEKIFERFRQGDLAEEHDGIGLGLAISKAYVEMLGGQIGVESEQGKGSEFFFTTPYIGDVRQEKAETADDDSTSTPHRLTILVAEDDDMSYFLINETLRKNNINSVHASDGREAVKIFHDRNDIDMVLMDIKLPVMNGIEATREIKKINPDIPVIAQSAYVSQEEIQKSIDAGCDDYISKPVDIKLLMSKIMKYGVRV